MLTIDRRRRDLRFASAASLWGAVTQHNRRHCRGAGLDVVETSEALLEIGICGGAFGSFCIGRSPQGSSFVVFGR